MGAVTRDMCRWLGEDRGAAAFEFVVMMPLLLAILVATAGFGTALAERQALDNAVRDATRVLSRAPLALETAKDGTLRPTIYPDFLEETRTDIAERTGSAVSDVTVAATARVLDDTGDYRTDIIIIEIRVSIAADFPLLAFLSRQLEPEDGPLRMTSVDRARWVAEVPVGAKACPQAERDAGTCGGPA